MINLFYAFSFRYFSLYLFKLGMAPQIEDLYGKVKFTGRMSRSAVDQGVVGSSLPRGTALCP